MKTHIYEEASNWLIEFRTEAADADTRQRFQGWLDASSEHVRAYLELTAFWEDISRVDARRALDVDALIDRARATINVVQLNRGMDSKPSNHGTTPSRSGEPSTQPALQQAPAPSVGRRSRMVWLAACVLCAIAIGSVVWQQRYREPTFATTVGEQRSIVLTDGSTVQLNARSRIRLRFSEHERAVDLLEGQALFQVAKDPGRPFVVGAGATRVRAVGTQFDVYRKHSGTIVTVVEGRVAILPEAQGSKSAAADGALELAAGEQVVVTRSAAPMQRAANVAAATAWTERRLVFDSTPLDEVAEEFNRYNLRPLVIEGAGLDDFHVSGAFSSTDPLPLLRFLRAQGVRVTESDKRIVIAHE